ncbi:tetratricopeptide repeat protein [bacterium]|nr:tetratricopeptide repeat protein [bacterium]
MLKKITFLLLLATCYLLLTTFSYAQADKELFTKANNAFVNREFKEARQLFEKYLSLYPGGEDVAPAKYNIAESFYQDGKFEEAIPVYEKVVASHEDEEIGMDAQNRIGDSYQKLASSQKAKKAYQKVVKDYPNTRQAEYAAYSLEWIKIAEEKEKEKEKEKIGQTEPVETVPKAEVKEEEKVSKEAQLKLAKDLFEAGKYKNARAEFEKFLESYPKDKFSSYAQLKLAETYYYEDDYGQSLKEYKKLKNYPSDKYTTYGQYASGWCHYHSGDYQGALKTFEDFLKEYPQSDYAPSAKDAILKIRELVREKEATDLYNQAKISYEEGDLEKTLSLLSRIVEKYPKTSNIEEIKEAKAKIEEKLYQAEAEDLFKQGKEALSEEKFFLAKEKFEKLLTQYPASEYSPEAKINLEEVSQILEEKAKLEYEKGKKLLEDSLYQEAAKKFEETAGLFAGTTYGDLSATELLALKAKSQEEKANELLKIGRANLSKGDLEGAQKNFLKIVEEYPYTRTALLAKDHLEKVSKDLREKEAYALYRAALSDLEKENYKEAAEGLEGLISSYPETEIVDEAKKARQVARQELTDRKAGESYDVAKRLFELGKIEEAKEAFLEVKEKFPDTDYAKLADKFIREMTRLEEEEAATLPSKKSEEEEIKKVIESKQAERIFDEANQLRKLGDFKGALSEYEALLREYPKSKEAPYAAYAKAEIFYFWENDYPRALDQWQNIIKDYPSSELIPHVLYHLAVTYENLDKKEEAQKTYKKLLNDFPQSIYGNGELLEMIKEKIGE